MQHTYPNYHPIFFRKMECRFNPENKFAGTTVVLKDIVLIISTAKSVQQPVLTPRFSLVIAQLSFKKFFFAVAGTFTLHYTLRKK
jgi:hypothetical protein